MKLPHLTITEQNIKFSYKMRSFDLQFFFIKKTKTSYIFACMFNDYLQDLSPKVILNDMIISSNSLSLYLLYLSLFFIQNCI